MWVGNVFSHVCVSVCVSVQTITFEPLDIEASFLVCRYIFTISRSSLSIKVIRSRSRSYEKNDNFTMFLPFSCSPYCQQAGGLHSTEMRSCYCVCFKDMRFFFLLRNSDLTTRITMQ